VKNSKASLLGRMLFLCVVLAAVCVPQVLATVTNYVGTCAGTPNFTTITAALATTPAPSVVEVCPGTYPEQLVISKAVKLEGIAASGADQVFITVPSGGLAANECSVLADQPVQVCVAEADTVDITNVAVDGTGATSPVGIYYVSTSGTLNQLELRFQEGDGIGMGIGLSGAANTVTVENSNVHDFDGTGIWVYDGSSSHNELTARIENNTLAPDPTASIGISSYGGKSVTISGNAIDGPATPPCSSTGTCAGIVAHTAVAGSITNNKVFGIGSSGVGIMINSGAGTMSVKTNTVFDVQGDGIQLNATSVPVTGNILMQVQNGIDLECNTNPGVTSNKMTAIHSVGLANVPDAVPVNSYYDTPTLYSACP
jgi:hypothetical protein